MKQITTGFGAIIAIALVALLVTGIYEYVYSVAASEQLRVKCVELNGTWLSKEKICLEAKVIKL